MEPVAIGDQTHSSSSVASAHSVHSGAAVVRFRAMARVRVRCQKDGAAGVRIGARGVTWDQVIVEGNTLRVGPW